MADSSFDVVSKIDRMELDNAILALILKIPVPKLRPLARRSTLKPIRKSAQRQHSRSLKIR